jgi:AcrR family transcriptional regulator
MTGGINTKGQLGVRGREILQSAGTLLLEIGYHDVNMGRIAETLSISRAAVYQYFTSKEDLLFALAAECLELRLDLLERAATFKGWSRERMLAVGEAAELASRLYPNEMRIAEIIRTQAAAERVTAARRMDVTTAQNRAVGLIMGIIRDAIAQEELVLPAMASAESLCFGFWTIAMGGYATLVGTLALPEMGIRDVYAAVKTNYQLMADGYGWHPLSSELDYNAVITRVRESVFPEESRQAYYGKN